MTLTETRPDEAPAAAAAAVPAAPTGWLSTADHKRLGLLYIAAALGFLVVGGVLGVALQGEMASAGDQLLGGRFSRATSLHSTVTPLLFLGPLWIGLATYLVPLQIGAARLALPRLHAFAFWLYATGACLVLAASVAGPQGSTAGFPAAPFTVPEGGADAEVSLWVTGLLAVAVAAFLAAVSLAVTTGTMRTKGMTLARTPLFSTATLFTSLVTVLATPVFVVGLLLLYADQHFGAGFFADDNPAALVVWQHTVWLFGRPEVYLLLLPGLGAACDIVATHARRPLLGTDAARTLLALFAGLSLTAWAAGSEVADAVVLPTYSPLTALVAVPVGLLVLLWLGSLAKGSPRFHPSLAFVAGFLGLAAFAAVNVVVAAFAEVDAGTAWTAGHVHVGAFGAPVLLAVAALYHWAPKLWGRELSAGIGGAVFILLFGGMFLNGLGSYLLGYDGAPAGIGEHVDVTRLNYSRLAAVGGALVLLGVLALLGDIVRAWAGRAGTTGEADPYDGPTLEWTAASPPAEGNFDSVPEVRSASPLYDLRTGGSA